jgi:hypothetical protein
MKYTLADINKIVLHELPRNIGSTEPRRFMAEVTVLGVTFAQLTVRLRNGFLRLSTPSMPNWRKCNHCNTHNSGDGEFCRCCTGSIVDAVSPLSGSAFENNHYSLDSKAKEVILDGISEALKCPDLSKPWVPISADRPENLLRKKDVRVGNFKAPTTLEIELGCIAVFELTIRGLATFPRVGLIEDANGGYLALLPQIEATMPCSRCPNNTPVRGPHCRYCATELPVQWLEDNGVPTKKKKAQWVKLVYVLDPNIKLVITNVMLTALLHQLMPENAVLKAGNGRLHTPTSMPLNDRADVASIQSMITVFRQTDYSYP